MIIEENLRDKMAKHTNQSLASNLTAEEKVEKVMNSLKNPQLVLLSSLLNKALDNSSSSYVSPHTRRKIHNEKARQESEELKMNNLYLSMRDVDMSDLRQLLSDIEAIEAEQKAAGILSQDEEQRYG